MQIYSLTKDTEIQKALTVVWPIRRTESCHRFNFNFCIGHWSVEGASGKKSLTTFKIQSFTDYPQIICYTE